MRWVVLFVGVALLWWPARLWVCGGAWRRLAARFPDTLGYSPQYRFPPVQVGALFLPGAHVGIESGGLHLATWTIARRLLPPIFLPWSEVQAVAEIWWRGRPGVELVCRETIRIGMRREEFP